MLDKIITNAWQRRSHRYTDTLIEAAEDAGIARHQLVRAMIWPDFGGFIMAILAAEHLLRFTALSGLPRRLVR